MRYALHYADKSKSFRDSARARKRIGSFAAVICSENSGLVRQFDKQLRHVQGVEIKYAQYAHQVETFFENAELDDMLSAITTFFDCIKLERSTKGPAWVRHVSQVFEQERLAYVIDENAYVRNKVDQEFDRNVFSAVASLESTRYQHTADALRRAIDASFSRGDVGAEAIRCIFEAAETLFKLTTDERASLDKKAVITIFLSTVQKAYEGEDAHAKSAAANMCNSFAGWVDACHNYRHGPKSEEVLRPPIEISVALVSQGASFIRWLVDVDRRVHPD